MSQAVADATVTASIDLAIGSRRLQGKIDVPASPTPLIQLLPIVRAVSDVMVSEVVGEAGTAGKPISCKAGCGACCRQVVPITEVEARRLREVVEEMPEPRRSEVRARFAAARQRLVEARLLELAQDLNTSFIEEVPFRDDYFRLGIPCPFLEDESCSIYPERPLICREYVVITPAWYCGNPQKGQMIKLHMPMQTYRGLAETNQPGPGEQLHWVALILALEWAEANPEPPPDRTGPELLQSLFENLTGRRVPPPTNPASADG